MAGPGFRPRESRTRALGLLWVTASRGQFSPPPGARTLTSLVALLNVAGARLHGGALAPAVEAVTGAAALLDPVAAGGGAGGPLGPGGPAVVCGVAGCRGNGFT